MFFLNTKMDIWFCYVLFIFLFFSFASKYRTQLPFVVLLAPAGSFALGFAWICHPLKQATKGRSQSRTILSGLCLPSDEEQQSLGCEGPGKESRFDLLHLPG